MSELTRRGLFAILAGALGARFTSVAEAQDVESHIEPREAPLEYSFLDLDGRLVFDMYHPDKSSREQCCYLICGDPATVRRAFPPDMGPGLHTQGDLACYEVRLGNPESGESAEQLIGRMQGRLLIAIGELDIWRLARA